jgi:hypothetical protein
MPGKAREPLRQPENLASFDPLNLAHWTLPMALTWIIWRDLDRVRNQHDLYDRHLRDANRLKGPDDEVFARLPPTRLKHLADLLLETEDPDLPQTFIVRGPAARDDLWHKLGTGTIVATGIPLGGISRRAIDGTEWVDLDSFDTDGPNYWPVDAIGAGHGDGIRFKSVRVASASVVATWAKVNAEKVASRPNRRGAKPAFDWEDGEMYLHRILDKRGDFTDANQIDGWCRQADAMRLLIGYLRTADGGPSDSRTKSRLPGMVDRWRAKQPKEANGL